MEPRDSFQNEAAAGIAIISDIHANTPALRAVLSNIDDRGIEAISCLGDLVGYGTDPNGVIDLIQERNIPTIAGNYDNGVGWERGDCGCFYATSEAKLLGEASYAFTTAEVTSDRKTFLRELPRERHLVLGKARLHLVHGSPRKINEYLLPDRDERTFLRIAKTEEDGVLVFGHTHVFWSRRYGGVLFINVGSVGRPKDGDPRATYALLTVTTEGSIDVETVRVAYDTEATARGVLAAGLPPQLADAFRRGV